MFIRVAMATDHAMVAATGRARSSDKCNGWTELEYRCRIPIRTGS